MSLSVTGYGEHGSRGLDAAPDWQTPNATPFRQRTSDGVTIMSLTNFVVVHEHSDPLDRVLIHCFDDRQMVLVFISREAIDDYFRRTGLSPRDRNLLIDRNLENLISVITAKYGRGEIGEYVGTGTQRFPQVNLSLADLEQSSEKLTDTVLDIAARASFQRG